MRRFELYEQIEPPSPRPYRIIETIDTCDGPRSRLSSLTFKNETEALDKVCELRAEADKEDVKS